MSTSAPTKESSKALYGAQYWNLAPIWGLLAHIANVREAYKKTLSTSRQLRGGRSTHMLGMAGEVVAAYIYGGEVNVDFYAKKGDGGADLFDIIDVKATSKWPPVLRVPVTTKNLAEWYCLVYVCEEEKFGIHVGTVSKADVLAAEVTQIRPGFPTNYTVPLDGVAVTPERLEEVKLSISKIDESSSSAA